MFIYLPVLTDERKIKKFPRKNSKFRESLKEKENVFDSWSVLFDVPFGQHRDNVSNEWKMWRQDSNSEPLMLSCATSVEVTNQVWLYD